jgi:hypothetical protein
VAFTMTAAVVLGAANTGLTLTAELRNADGTAAAGLTTTNLAEVAAGSGSYTWTGTLPDNHRGYIRFLDGATFKAQVPVDPAEVERVDVKVSTRSSHSAADAATSVWAAGTRTLTSFGTLVADIWAYASRTLTLTAAQIAAILTGSSLIFERGDTWTISLTGLGSLAGRSKLWFTLKSQHSHTDAQSLVQIEETAGLLYLNGAAAGTAADGSITVTDANAGDVTITLKPAATATLSPATRLYWDVQTLTGTVVSTRTTGTAQISPDVTRSLS